MSAIFTEKTTQQFIEHEVRLRVNDEKFQLLGGQFGHMNSKLNWIIGIIISSIVLPSAMHYLSLI